MNSSMRLTRCRVPAPRVRCSCPCDHVRGQLVWVVADQTPQRPAIAPASRPDRPSSWQGSMPRRPARERRPYLDEASTAVFRWAAFRRCAFGVEAFASAPLKGRASRTLHVLEAAAPPGGGGRCASDLHVGGCAAGTVGGCAVPPFIRSGRPVRVYYGSTRRCVRMTVYGMYGVQHTRLCTAFRCLGRLSTQVRVRG